MTKKEWMSRIQIANATPRKPQPNWTPFTLIKVGQYRRQSWATEALWRVWINEHKN